MSNNHYDVEASTSRCKTRSTPPPDHLFKDDRKSRRRNAELQQLEGRLRALEEEAEMLKGALLESVEESKRLITEIHQHFNTIHHRVLQRQGESYCHRIQIMSLFEELQDNISRISLNTSQPHELQDIHQVSRYVRSFEESLCDSCMQDRRHGLLQVLCQDSYPSIDEKGLNFQPKLPWNFQDGN